jgi:hypothetical protein
MSLLDPLMLITIQDNGVALKRRPNHNFIGVTITDDPTNKATVLDFTGLGGGGGGGPQVAVAESVLSPQPTYLDFTNDIPCNVDGVSLEVTILSLQDHGSDLGPPQPKKLNIDAGLTLSVSSGVATVQAAAPTLNIAQFATADGVTEPTLDPDNHTHAIIAATGAGATCHLPAATLGRVMSIWLAPGSTDALIITGFTGGGTLTLDFVTGSSHHSCTDVYRDPDTGDWVAYRIYPRAIPNP